MTGKLRPRGGPTKTGAAADCVVLPNRHRAVAPASVVDSIERRYSGAVTVARHISQREAVGEIAADHTFTNFTDSARCVSLWRLSSPHTLGKPRRILTSHIPLGQSLSGSSALRSTSARTESRCDDGNVSWRAHVLNVSG
jgi:hypothetical protein